MGQSDGHAVLWDANGKIHDLGSGGATSINNNGQVVGASDNNAVLWDADGKIHDLGTGGNAVVSAINNNGQVIGYSSDTTGSLHAALFRVKPGR